MSIDGRWQAYKIKHHLNNHDIFKSYVKKEGTILNALKTENEITNDTREPGYSQSNIDFNVPSGLEFHFLYIKIHTELVNNTVNVRLYVAPETEPDPVQDQYIQWGRQLPNSEIDQEMYLPFDKPAPENSQIIWTAQNTNAAPSRLVYIEYYGFFRNLKAA